jgi:RNA polymerase sigma-70 factor (ECF subfamily)
MIEGKQLVAGDAILSPGVTLARTQDEVLEELVRQHARLVYRIAYAALRSHPDAEDAAQETFLRVLRYRDKLVSVEDYKSWLARIAWRVAVDRSRQRGRKREVGLEDPEKLLEEAESTESQATETVYGAQVGAVLERLIAALPEKLREPLVLSTLEEMSPREVAATLGINEATVRSRVFRARQLLKDKLAAQIGRK